MTRTPLTPDEVAADPIGLDAMLSDDERAVRDRVRAFVDTELRPHLAEWYENAVLPRELLPAFGELGVLGMMLAGDGLPGRSAVEYGLAAAELEAADSGLRTVVSVQGSLAMTAIHTFGTDDQKAQHLTGMAAGHIVGCFGLTEPNAGSDPGSMTTYARRDGDDWVLTGAKRWIGLASIADIAVVWAQTDDGIRGFIVPTDAPGFTATPITAKLSMRASVQCDLTFDDVRLPADALLPGARGLSGPFTCLNSARYGIVWGAMGAARDSLEAARRYALDRVAFERPIAAAQLTQAKLADMTVQVSTGTLLALHLGRLKDQGLLQPHQISIGKLNNVRTAVAVAQSARTILGGNGITGDYSPMRHAQNLESVRTYEGTDEVHALVIGSALTGLPAFR
ncbi:acyl-CoA dehydrogenase family protein [Microcella alkaliphila]|nr:acyl-CoA dehydrogenase family protein [Microcella alkaliphila]